MICFFNTTKAWGGGEKWHFDVATRLITDEIPVIVVTHPDSALRQKFHAAGVKAHTVRTNNRSFLNVLKLFRLYLFFKQHQVDTLVMNLPADLKLAGIAARLAGVKKIIYRRGSAIPIRNTWLNRFLFKKVITGVLTNSFETKRTILSANKNLISPEKIRVIYNGLNLKNFPAKEKSFVKVHGQPIIIGNLGRLEKQKAQHLLISLGEKLVKAGINFKILIGGDGSLKEDLQTQIQNARLPEKISLLGYVDDVHAFMKEIDIFVLTSHWEGFGYVLAEAMACLNPVVAFGHSSNPELIADKITGFLVVPGDLDDLFNKVLLLIRNPELRKKMGVAGREKVEKEFDFEKNFQQLKEFLFD